MFRRFALVIALCLAPAAVSAQATTNVVIATAPDTETVVNANLDFQRLRDVRRQVPSLANRQPDAYAWPEPVGLTAAGGSRAAAR